MVWILPVSKSLVNIVSGDVFVVQNRGVVVVEWWSHHGCVDAIMDVH